MTNQEKRYLILAAAALLAVWLVFSWWRSGSLDAVDDMAQVSSQIAHDVQDIVTKAKQKEEQIRNEKVQAVEALPCDDVAYGLNALLRGTRPGR